jgi:hypothetical protein
MSSVVLHSPLLLLLLLLLLQADALEFYCEVLQQQLRELQQLQQQSRQQLPRPAAFVTFRYTHLDWVWVELGWLFDH